MAAGSTMTGHVIVENDTGSPVHATQCHGYFAVVLTSPDVAAEGGFPACAEGITFPVGESTYPVDDPRDLPRVHFRRGARLDAGVSRE